MVGKDFLLGQREYNRRVYRRTASELSMSLRMTLLAVAFLAMLLGGMLAHLVF